MLDQARSNEVLTYLHGGGAPPSRTGSNLRLMTANGTATANGTEVTGGSYPAGGAALTWGAAAAASQATSAARTFTGMPATTTVGVEVWTTTAPVRIELGNLTTSRTTAAGDTLSFDPGAITSSLT